MTNFINICIMSQKSLKDYMEEYLTDCGYDPINEDGFLYAKGTIPVLLIAHMDTVHKMTCIEVHTVNGKISSPQGIGGDDRCGIFIIMNIIKELHCSVLLCEDEEIGTVGARKFANTDYINNLEVNYMIEFDRKGNNDAVFYRCNNKDFEKFVTSTTGFKTAHGTFSDISVIAPVAKIAAVNLSSGYYNAHTTEEYVIYEEMMHTIDVAKELILTESEPFEYVEWKYEPSYTYSHNAYEEPYHQMSLFEFARNDFDVNLEVVFEDIDGEEQIGTVQGQTKAEAWATFFLSNPEICFNQIMDYNFT